jgi:hypothetical protein
MRHNGRVVARWRHVVGPIVVAGAATLALFLAGLAPGTPARASGLDSGLPQASGGLDVLPFPGTPDAPAGTRIDFPAVAPAQIASLRVVGSRTGRHAGSLSAQPGGRGTQFTPRRPFAAGERVSVTAVLRSEAAAADSGAPGVRSLHFSFQIARPAPGVSLAAADDSLAKAHCGPQGYGPRGSGSKKPPVTHSFHSAPRLHPPVVEMFGKDTDTTAGDIFLDANNSGHNGPYILNPQGDLLWFHPLGSCRLMARGVRVQSYERQPVLTYYQGPRSGGTGVILNEHYQRIHTVRAGDGYKRYGLDTHEFQLTPQGTALVTVHANVHANLSSVGGPRNGVVSDAIVQDIDIATGRVVWEWSALAHLRLTDSYATYHRGHAYDAFHLNSIQEVGGNTVIISVRHTWAVYSISMKTGKINWELGGKHSSYKIGPGANFEWQHDARLHARGLLTVFDNGAGLRKDENQSRALEIRLSGRTARLVHAYDHVPPVLAWSQGSVQLLPHGNVFVGWGESPTFSEYTQSGRQIFKAWFRSPAQSYRAYRDQWTGLPLGAPSIDVKPSGGGKITVYASWNGATQIVRWRVLTGSPRTKFTAVAHAHWLSFETSIPLTTRQPQVEVQAIAQDGKVLGTSRVVSSRGGCAGPEC